MAGGCAIQQSRTAYSRLETPDRDRYASIAGVECAVDELVDATAPVVGASPSMRAAAATASCASVSPQPTVTRSSRSIIVPFWIRAARRGSTRRALAEVLKPTSKPLDIQVTAVSTGLDVISEARGRCPQR